MSVVVIRIVSIAVLIVLAGLLSLSRFALVTARKTLLRERAARGNPRAVIALDLSERLKKVGLALRLGATLAVTLAGVICGFWLAASPDPSPEFSLGMLAIAAIVAGTITVANVLIVELLPRRFVLQEPEDLACRLAGSTRVFSALSVPLVDILQWISDRLIKLLGIRTASRGRITHEELTELLGEAVEGAALEPSEAEIFKRAFRFFERRARTIMTPRAEVVWIDLADSPEEVRRKVMNTSHSRFPVCDQSLDNLLGIVQVKDLLAQRPDGQTFRVKGHLTLPAFIFEGTRGPQILESLKQSASQIAVVLDEYGSVVGLLTLKDILESVLGNLPESKSESEVPKIVLKADGSRSIDGRLPIDEFRELYDLSSLPEGDYETLAGLVVTELGHIPHPSETLDFQGLRLEVTEVSANRVVRILVRSLNGQLESS